MLLMQQILSRPHWWS